MIVLLLAVCVPASWLAWSLWTSADAAPRDDAVQIKMQTDGGAERLKLRRNDDGSYVYVILSEQGIPREMSPDKLADWQYRREGSRPWLHRLLNISTPFGVMWVAVGLLGQLLFTGRMIVQWLASERRRQSIVPPIFWWMSLIGAAMLLVYFIWRRDIVGVLGQSFGLLVYMRNLSMIHGLARSTRLQSVDDGSSQ